MPSSVANHNVLEPGQVQTAAQQESIKTIKQQCLTYLARREHSRVELYQKLIAKGFHSVGIQTVLDDLQSHSYQSDERFSDMYIRSRIHSGDGPFKIKIALRAKGICDSLVLAVFDKLDIDWVKQAADSRRKRFGSLAPETTEDALAYKAKQVRYLKNKGYYQEHINAVINQAEYE